MIEGVKASEIMDLGVFDDHTGAWCGLGRWSLMTRPGTV